MYYTIKIYLYSICLLELEANPDYIVKLSQKKFFCQFSLLVTEKVKIREQGRCPKHTLEKAWCGRHSVWCCGGGDRQISGTCWLTIVGCLVSSRQVGSNNQDLHTCTCTHILCTHKMTQKETKNEGDTF